MKLQRPRPPAAAPGMTRRDLLRRAAAGAAAVAGAGLLAPACGGPTSNEPPAPAPPAPTPTPAPAVPAPSEADAGKKKILILGGTGFLGPALVEAAQASGHTLTLFNRGKSNPGLFPDVEKLQGDRDGKLGALEGRRWDAVIDTSGYVPRIVKQSADLLASAVDQYVFISTISVYADLSIPNLDESGPLAVAPDPQSEDVKAHYGALKVLCERQAEASMPGRALVIRPGLIVGPRDPTGRFTYWPVRVERGGEVLAPGTGADPVQLIDVRDLAAWTIHMVEDKGTGTFNALGPAGRLEMKTMLEEVKAAIPGSTASFTWVPADFLEKEKVGPWMDMPCWIPTSGDHAGVGTLSNARAVSRGLSFRPIGESTTATLAWLKTLDAAERARVTQGAGLAADREAKVLARWSARGAKGKKKKAG